MIKEINFSRKAVEKINQLIAKIPSKYASKPLGKIERIEKTHLKSVLKSNFHFP